MKRFLILMTLLAVLAAALMACDTAEPADPTVEDTTAAVTENPAETSAQAPTEADTETPAEPETEEETTVNVIYETIQNPIAPKGSDPWVIRHGDKYYYCYASHVWFLGGVAVAEVPSPDKVGTTEGSQVYTAPAEGDTSHSFEYWAPELHYLNGEWYIYVAADDGNNENHRMYVLKGTSQDPTDPFEFVGQITDPVNRWAIDGTVMELNGELYFIWSGWKGTVNVAQHIYIAHMSDPCTIDGKRVLISSPEYDWEMIGEPHVNEGPTVLQHGGKTFVTYSASGSWTDDYCLGMLTLEGDDPLDPASWRKSERPVFQKEKGLCYGPGHSSFTTAVDGSVWMIFHGNLESGTGWAGRSVWLSPVTFDGEGNPYFGKPEKEVQFPVGVE